MIGNRTTVVTGAASGIGLGICHALAEAGHRIAMFDVQGELLEQEASKLRSAGAEVLALAVDVVDREQVEEAYRRVRRDLGPIEVVVPNAGIARAHDFLTLSQETWRHMLDVNLTGVFNTIQPALTDMIERKWGRVITISSVAGQSGAPDRAHYACTKGGVIALTMALAQEFASHGITVNSIAPALVDTPLMRKSIELGELPALDRLVATIPIARAGTPADVGHVCAFLASEGSSYITGQVIAPNGGVYM